MKWRDILLIYLLVAMLTCILIMAYIFSNQDLFSPWVIIVASFLNSSVLAMLNIHYWNYEFHFNTCLIITSAVLIFGMGALVSNYIFMDTEPLSGATNSTYFIHPVIVLLVTIFLLILSYFSFQEVYQTSLRYGNTGGYVNMIRAIRPFIESNELSFSRYHEYRNIISFGIASFFLIIFVYNFINLKFKIWVFLLLLPVMAYIPVILLSTGRVGFLQLMVIFITSFAILYQKKHGYSFRTNIKIIAMLCVVVGIFLISFFSAGHLTGKVISTQRTPFVIISHYTGAQIPAFDVFLNEDYVPDNYLVGSITLLGIHGNLRTLGFHVPKPNMFLSFTYFDNVSTNVYTSLRRYIQDYGFTGMWIIVFILGVGYTTIYNLIKYQTQSIWLLIIYSMFSLPLFMFGHDDMFLTGIVTSRNVYLMAILYFFCRILVYYNNSKKKGI